MVLAPTLASSLDQVVSFSSVLTNCVSRGSACALKQVWLPHTYPFLSHSEAFIRWTQYLFLQGLLQLLQAAGGFAVFLLPNQPVLPIFLATLLQQCQPRRRHANREFSTPLSELTRTSFPRQSQRFFFSHLERKAGTDLSDK